MKKTFLKHVVVSNEKSIDTLTYATYLDDIFQYDIQVIRTEKNTDHPIGHIALNTQIFFNIKSPDGFPISITDFLNLPALETFFEQWKESYKKQGYYSSVNYGKIPLSHLDDYCSIYKVYSEE